MWPLQVAHGRAFISGTDAWVCICEEQLLGLLYQGGRCEGHVHTLQWHLRGNSGDLTHVYSTSPIAGMAVPCTVVLCTRSAVDLR
jgi:hypothetical protein